MNFAAQSYSLQGSQEAWLDVDSNDHRFLGFTENRRNVALHSMFFEGLKRALKVNEEKHKISNLQASLPQSQAPAIESDL